MNILFIEDERELAVTGVAQLELLGYTVFSAHDLAGAQAVLDDAQCAVHYIITDHRLPDGLGIQFVLDLKESFPLFKNCFVNSLQKKEVDPTLIGFFGSMLYGALVIFVVRPWVNSADYWTVKFDFTQAVKEKFDAEGISIPFPQRDIHVFQQNAS